MATILVIDDEAPITTLLATFYERLGHRTVCAATGGEGIAAFHATHPDLVVVDVKMPDMSGFDVLAALRPSDPVVVMITAHGDVRLAVEAMQNGAENFLTKPVELAHLGAVTDRALEKSRLRRMSRLIATRRTGDATRVLGTSPAMRELAEQVAMLGRSERTTVLILGESGTGKGRIAQAIHAESARATGPFVEVSCGAYSAEELDGELFGADGGSAGGKGGRHGVFEDAAEGSLFLDEIGDVPATLQPKLVRALEGRAPRRAASAEGEAGPKARVIAATAKDLVNEVTAGTFREDLYYQLSVMPLYLPPLRARSREDIADLVGHLSRELHAQLPEAPVRLSEAALDRLMRYAWPGNIRELRNVLERAMIVGRGADQIEERHFPTEVRDANNAGVEHHVPRSLDDVERAHIERTLRAHAANRTRTAKELGISRATLIKKIKEYRLNGA
ncbi:MAG: acetoacetate metabolism transcriptional regulator AtoC [Gemmatimonadaceae bacterium]